jgi:hypothetical protein
MFLDRRFFGLVLTMKKNLPLIFLSCIETAYAAVKVLDSSINPARKVLLSVYSASGLLRIQNLKGHKMVVEGVEMEMLNDENGNNNHKS